jgi:hypothetical protein
MSRVLLNTRIGRQIEVKRVADAVVDNDLIALFPLLLADREAFSVITLLIDKIADAQREEVGDPERGVNTDDE